MSSVKNGKKKDIKIILLGILVGLVVCGAGIYGVVSSRIASHEYKNSTDIREVSAVVGYCREVVNKDKDDLVFFKAPDAEAFQSAFKEYSASLLSKSKRPSVLAKLHLHGFRYTLCVRIHTPRY